MNTLIKVTVLTATLACTACAKQAIVNQENQSGSCKDQSAAIVGGTAYCL